MIDALIGDKLRRLPERGQPVPRFRGRPARVLLCACAIVSLPACAQERAPLSECIATLRKELPQYPRLQASTFDARTRDVQDLRPVIDKASGSQPEFKLAVWDYLAKLNDAQRAIDGRRILQSGAEALAVIQRRSRIDAATVVAVFGVETDYGNVRGRYPVIDATLSRACLMLDSKERKRHFFDALWLVQEGFVQADLFMGSWAGAFGLTQFMPGTFVQFMDDADGHGKPDIIGSVPDALATTARYLQSLGWKDGLPWGVEVKASAAAAAFNTPEQSHACLAGTESNTNCKTVQQWAELGVRRVGGEPLSAAVAAASSASATSTPAAAPRLPAADTRAALLMPAGAAGPAWLITTNYQAIWRYNRADAYALAIGLLSDALRGDPPQQAAWPTDDPGLSREQFRQLQSLLAQRGHAGVTPDGLDGALTQAAIRAEEQRLGWRESGRGGQKMLKALINDPPPAQSAASQADLAASQVQPAASAASASDSRE